MSRHPRIVIPDIPHHVTQRGNFQESVFSSEVDYRTYCRMMNKYSRQHDMAVMAFCLMENHVHFIAVPSSPSTLAKVFHVVHTRYARYVNENRRRVGHLWQGRFYSCPMDEGHLRRAVRYVESNPVRSGLAKHPWEYRWSSASSHTGKARSPIDITDTTLITSRSEWRAYLKRSDKALEKEIRRGTRRGLPVGARPFIERLEADLGRVLTPQQAGRPRGGKATGK